MPGMLVIWISLELDDKSKFCSFYFNKYLCYILQKNTFYVKYNMQKNRNEGYYEKNIDFDISR